MSCPDAHYLREFARALAITAARAPTENDILMFSRHAAGALEVETGTARKASSHDFALDDRRGRSHAARTDHARLHELPAQRRLQRFLPGGAGSASALLLDLLAGREPAVEQGSPNPPYLRWIDTCGGEEFGTVVAEVLALTDRLATVLSDSRARTHDLPLLATSRYEWMFWEMGYRQEHWPL